jgi:Arc/MetJ family transcription regulator
MSRTRTNIEIDDADVRLVMERYAVPTKTAAVALALRHLAGQPMTREEALAMHGAHAIAEVPADYSPVGELEAGGDDRPTPEGSSPGGR